MKHTKCMIIGLTGGIASGKSTVSSILIEKGFRVIDSDKISREVVDIGEPAYEELVDYFGEVILNNDGRLNRQKLGDIVFTDEKLLQVLNSITHPYIFKELKEQIYDKCVEFNIIFVDIPLLFERYDEFITQGIIFDEIWLIYVDKETQLDRLMLRNNLNKKQAIDGINAQIPLEKKKEKATRIINNNGDIEQLNKNVEKLLQELM